MYADLTEAIKQVLQQRSLRQGALDVLRSQTSLAEASDSVKTYVLGQALPDLRRSNPILAATWGSLLDQAVSWEDVVYDLGWEPPPFEDIPF